MSKAVEKNWIRSTCRIITDGGSGTGFFLNDNKRKRIYLVTNKHVIHSYKKERNSIREVKLDINVIDNGGQTKSDEVLYSFRDGLYREHEDLDTDVYILDVTEMFATLLREHGIKPNHFAAPLDYLLTDETMRLDHSLQRGDAQC